MNLGLEGRACVVTGASLGIGLETARLLCAEGASVLLVARGEEALRSATEQCAAAAGGRAEWLSADVTEPDTAERVVAECERRFGSLDVLVNNAGTSAVRPFEELTDEDWDQQWQLNVMAPMRLMRAAAPGMAERGWGRIVNVASSSGKRPSDTNLAYGVGKAAELSLSRGFAERYAKTAVRVNALTPGPVESPLWMAEGGIADQIAARRGVTRDEALDTQRGRVPIGRFAQSEEIASVIVFLCSEQASNVHGAAWSADGGTVQVII
jgi:NAD(P)-dependent dehydrogenase (short-subunit alcohol dehydrogenase family)